MVGEAKRGGSHASKESWRANLTGGFCGCPTFTDGCACKGDPGSLAATVLYCVYLSALVWGICDIVVRSGCAHEHKFEVQGALVRLNTRIFHVADICVKHMQSDKT